MTKGAAIGLALALVAASLGSTSSAEAQPSEGPKASSGDASAHFERGMAFFRDGDYVAAMVEFKKAYELDPNWRGLYNLGQTSRELRDYAAALTSFERYLAEGGSEIDPARRQRVEGWVAELKSKVATVTLAVEVAGAEVTVDDVLIGTTPLKKPMVMNAGRRKINVSKPGYAPLSRFVDVAGTESKTLELELVPLTSEGGGPQVGATTGGTSRPDTVESSPSPAPWILLGVTGALGVATGVMGALTLSAKSDFDDALGDFPTTPGAIEDARSKAENFALGTDILAGVTAAAGITTIILFVTTYSADDPEPAAKSGVRVGIGPGFVSIGGDL